jgi:predicted AAA+ superfamily ATPase
MSGVAALALEGAKGVGKTETALRYAASVVELDDPAQLAVATADPRESLERPTPVLIDEWQRSPAIWDAVRRAVDGDPRPGRYLLTGSAAPIDADTHSGAGRIVRVRMRPMSLVERAVADPTVSLADVLMRGPESTMRGHSTVDLAAYTQEIVRSGLPGIRQLSGRALRAQLDSYLARIVDRDFEEQGHRVRRPEVLLRWMRAYAAATSTCASLETVRDAATGGEADKPSKATTGIYRDVLERLWIVEPLAPWLPSRNRIAALGRSPKHHLADPALAAALLGVSGEMLLQGRAGDAPPGLTPPDGTFLGQLFESLVTQSVRVYAQAAEATVSHLRTHQGRQEIDLIVARRDGSVVAIEVKLGATVDDRDVRHLNWLKQQFGDTVVDRLIVTTGPQAYRRPDGVAVVPLALLGP